MDDLNRAVLTITKHSKDFDPSVRLWQAFSPADMIEWSPSSLRHPRVLSDGNSLPTIDRGRSIAVTLLHACRFLYCECRQLLYALNAFSFGDLQEFEEFSSRYLDADENGG